MNKDKSKYFNEWKYLFASYGKNERKYLNKIKNGINTNDSTLTYEDIVERLGTPKEVIINYYEQEDIYDLIKKAKIIKFLRSFLIIFLIIIAVFLSYKSYIYQQEYNEIKNSSNGYFEEIIE